nr:retrovirus-related Pol polyprotein from transposon TNT 1-94 [Tanacetum cinerariifolium]
MTGDKSKEQPPRANTVMISSTSAYDSKTSEPNFIPNLSIKDWATIMNLVKTQKSCHTEKFSGKNVNYEQIVDSGASHHMTGCLGLLTNVQDIVAIPVELPLDIETFVVKKGTMRLTNNIFLSNLFSFIREGCFSDVSPDVAFISVDNVGNENAQSLESDSLEIHDRSKNDISESVAEPPILSSTGGGNVGSVDPTESHEQINDSLIPRPCTSGPINNLSSSEPSRYSQAAKDKIWCDAMEAKIDGLESNRTLELVTLPPGKKAIGYKWLYKTKYNIDSTVERHKDRLVIYENKQQEGTDYKETFAPVAKMVIVRTFLSVAVVKN